jgi:hypothetical protein
MRLCLAGVRVILVITAMMEICSLEVAHVKSSVPSPVRMIQLAVESTTTMVLENYFLLEIVASLATSWNYQQVTEIPLVGTQLSASYTSLLLSLSLSQHRGIWRTSL